MIHITFKNSVLAALLAATFLAGCGGGEEYSHRAEERGGEAWLTVETMLAAICAAKTVEAAVGIHCPEGDPKAMVFALGQIRKAKRAVLVKLDRFGDITRATVELIGEKSSQSKPSTVLALLLSFDKSTVVQIVSVN
jgi:hypothetical protein